MAKNASNKALLKKTKELEDEVFPLKRLATILIDRNEMYQTIFNTCPFGIVITDLNLEVLDTNFAFLSLLHCKSAHELKKTPFDSLMNQDGTFQQKKASIRKIVMEGSGRLHLELVAKNGTFVPVLLTAHVAIDERENPAKVVCFLENVTTHMLGQAELSQQTLEIQGLKSKLKEQENALKVFLKQAKKNQRDFEDTIILNIREIVFPYLDKIQKTQLSDQQQEYITLIKSHLNDVISPFFSKLSSKYSNLTPTEIRIAGLVKEGKTTKDIARILVLSAGTVEFHRNNLRKKLDIRNTKINLRSHLLSMG